MKAEDEKIDFVITWVDGNDEKWQAEKNKYSKEKKDDSNSLIRYRDWELLKFWFRGIEKYTPWVNKIFFVTCGQIPKWLNKDNEKIILIDHNEYIPSEYLPTFNSNVIEIYMNRIPGLSEKFVYFNDDTFIVDYMKPKDFFEKGKPKDALNFNIISAQKENNLIGHIILNNMEILENNFSKMQFIKHNFSKVFNMKYGIENVKSILLLPWTHFSGINNQHMPISYLKSTFDEVWNKENERLIEMSKNRFRTKDDYNLWIFKYWQLLTGNFIPKSYKKCKYYDLKNNNYNFIKEIKQTKYNMICINDSNLNLNFDKVQHELKEMFEEMFPNKSVFEK